jgi:ubiquitin conjugation factor E4 B
VGISYLCPFVLILNWISKPLGFPEVVAPLLSLSALAMPLLSSSDTVTGTLGPSDISQFLHDLAQRFEPDGELQEVFGPIVVGLLFHPSLLRPEGLGGGDSSWRGIIGGLEVLVSIKSVAIMITQLPEWNPTIATAANFEQISLFGPLCRLGVFTQEWVWVHS